MLNTLGAVDQATGFMHLCARHPADVQPFKGAYICLIWFRFFISMERSLTKRVLTVTPSVWRLKHSENAKSQNNIHPASLYVDW